MLSLVVPPEVEARRDIAALERLVLAEDGAGAPARAGAAKKSALLRTRIERGYYEKFVARLGR